MTHSTPSALSYCTKCNIGCTIACMPSCPIALLLYLIAQPEIFGIAQWVSALIVYIAVLRYSNVLHLPPVVTRQAFAGKEAHI